MMRIMAYLRGIRKTCCAVCLSSIAALELMAYISHGSLRTCTLLTEDLQLPDASAVAGTFMHDMTPIRRQASSVEPTTLFLGCVGYELLKSMATMSNHSGCLQWPPVVFSAMGSARAMSKDSLVTGDQGVPALWVLEARLCIIGMSGCYCMSRCRKHVHGLTDA